MLKSKLIYCCVALFALFVPFVNSSNADCNATLDLTGEHGENPAFYYVVEWFHSFNGVFIVEPQIRRVNGTWTPTGTSCSGEDFYLKLAYSVNGTSWTQGQYAHKDGTPMYRDCNEEGEYALGSYGLGTYTDITSTSVYGGLSLIQDEDVCVTHTFGNLYVEPETSDTHSVDAQILTCRTDVTQGVFSHFVEASVSWWRRETESFTIKAELKNVNGVVATKWLDNGNDFHKASEGQLRITFNVTDIEDMDSSYYIVVKVYDSEQDDFLNGGIDGGIGTSNVLSLENITDWDGDGDVDGADFLIWQDEFEGAGNPAGPEGDADFDGDVDWDDYLIWQAEYEN